MMEWIGYLAFVIILCYSSYPSRVKKLERKVKLLERKLKGENEMSKIITYLLGKECKIRSEEVFGVFGETERNCTVLELDEEWVKVSYNDKKGKKFIKILRIEDIDSIEISE